MYIRDSLLFVIFADVIKIPVELLHYTYNDIYTLRVYTDVEL